MNYLTTVERTSEREVAISRVINGPARLVFEAWTRAELLEQWWVPKSVPIKLLSCEADVRVGGAYRLVFDAGCDQTMAFFGKYLEVVPPSRLSWSNDEGGEDAAYITTVTFTEEDNGEKTRVVLSERHPSKEALDAALESGACEGTRESFEQLDAFVATRPSSA